MLVVISDLHFEEEAVDFIAGSGDRPPVNYSRNLPGKVYQRFFSHLAGEAIRNNARHLDLVLAGDIFDLHRTSLWFWENPSNLRPYVSVDGIGEELEAFILSILSKIKAEPDVGDSLEKFRLLVSGKHGERGELDFPVPVKLHYIPGNHDRLVNVSPAIRGKIEQLLGLQVTGNLFPHVLEFEQIGAIVRHGHEYDRFNFSTDIRGLAEIPLHLAEEEYAMAPFGDFVTVEIASRLPFMFRRHHGDEKILADKSLRRIYERLLEFDDLRPQRAMLNYLMGISEKTISDEEIWRNLEPIIIQLLDSIHDHPFLLMWMDKMDKKWRLEAVDIIQSALSLKAWRFAGIPLGLARFLSNTLTGDDLGQPNVRKLAARESGILSGKYRFVIASHTHQPRIELLDSGSTGERYYIDTGTWRNRITVTPDNMQFGRLKALSYVTLYGPDEDLGSSNDRKTASMDFWSGMTQRWNA